MKCASVLIVGSMAFLALGGSYAEDLDKQMRVQIDDDQVHSGMPAGTYVCAAGHLHVKATVQNLGNETVGTVKVAGKALDAHGKVLGIATATTRQAQLEPLDSAPIDMEFKSVTGPLLERVKSEDLAVVSVAPKP